MPYFYIFVLVSYLSFDYFSRHCFSTFVHGILMQFMLLFPEKYRKNRRGGSLNRTLRDTTPSKTHPFQHRPAAYHLDQIQLEKISLLMSPGSVVFRSCAIRVAGPVRVERYISTDPVDTRRPASQQSYVIYNWHHHPDTGFAMARPSIAAWWCEIREHEGLRMCLRVVPKNGQKGQEDQVACSEHWWVWPIYPGKIWSSWKWCERFAALMSVLLISKMVFFPCRLFSWAGSARAFGDRVTRFLCAFPCGTIAPCGVRWVGTINYQGVA